MSFWDFLEEPEAKEAVKVATPRFWPEPLIQFSHPEGSVVDTILARFSVSHAVSSFHPRLGFCDPYHLDVAASVWCLENSTESNKAKDATRSKGHRY